MIASGQSFATGVGDLVIFFLGVPVLAFALAIAIEAFKKGTESVRKDKR